MARPKKQGLDYFSFDCDFFSDEKVVAIAGEFGLKGEIVIVHLLCAIYRNGYFYKWDELAKMKMLHELPGVNAELLDKIVSRLLLWEFFDRALFESSIVLTSRGIQKRYFEATKWRTPTEDLPYILDNLGFCKSYRCKTGVLQKKTPIKQELMPQIKGNNIKESSYEDKKSRTVEQVKSNFEGVIAQLRTDELWRKTMLDYLKATPEQLEQAINEFVVHCCAEGKYHQDLREAQKHFKYWLDIKQTIKTKQSNPNATDKSNRLQRRRGFEPTDTQSKTYDEPL
jgi:hypothetical protein